MDYIKIRLADDFDQLGAKFQKTITDMFSSMSPMYSFSKNTWYPPLDIFETKTEIIVIAEMAGVNKEDLDLEINSRAIRMAGKRIGVPPAENGKYRLAEIQYGNFERVLYLPAAIDTDSVNATYKKGLLYIRVNKLIRESRHNVPISDE
ncbi:MAG TPA: Hsp20/alpha crystallin family protein [Desulfosalsimonadaceae bacterium]|nr:Hsp20/alpha crystallin family protein [Desulfosalsimonadaceae bacterium]